MPDKGFEDLAAERIVGMLDPMADAMAARMGMPPGGRQYSQREQDEEWNYSPIADPQVRVQAMLELRGLGKSDEEITDAIYPNRRRLISTGRPKVQDQIRFAQQMARRMEKLAAEAGMSLPTMEQPQAAPAPEPMPAPAMPAPEPMSAAPVAPTPAPPPAPSSMLDRPFSAIGG